MLTEKVLYPKNNRTTILLNIWAEYRTYPKTNMFEFNFFAFRKMIVFYDVLPIGQKRVILLEKFLRFSRNTIFNFLSFSQKVSRHLKNFKIFSA